ncbi:MAG TPA: long-chain fatty acid--CoA ligase, partial [Myxococcales bacterium]|nr:long-chain fatty acid--CoA ligase [Myxococcales bacterium]
MAIDSIVNRLFTLAQSNGGLSAYFVKNENEWVGSNYSTYSQEVKQAARALIALGFNAGDTTCILGFNRPEWTIFDLATMAAGGAPAGIYTTCSSIEVQYIIGHAESKIVLVENEAQWDKIRQERARLPKLQKVILMSGAAAVNDAMTMSWEDFLAQADNATDEQLQERIDGLKDDEVATFIYTSGTTGPPKAVMLSHKNLTWTADLARKITDIRSTDTSLSYLPLSHIAEQMFSIHGPITAGSSIYFAESLDDVAPNLKEVQPTVIFGVPRIWEKFYAGVTAKLALATGVKAKLVSWAMNVGIKANAIKNSGGQVGGLLNLQYKLANKLIYSKLRPALGLGNARMCVSGAAPIAAEILAFFAGLDVIIHEVYGQSEDYNPTTFNLPGSTRYGTVGQILPGVEVKLLEDGEIVVRGNNVFMGYYKDAAATNEALVDGWLQSGDLGSFDSDGYLTITGRKKDIIITAGGKNIAPKNIEAALKNLDLISEAIVIGDRRKFLSALVTIDPERLVTFAEANSTTPEEALK